ncbi:MAG: hypothetical protein ABIM74_07005 [candidate division WOR-3 bacterium]
MTRFILPGLMFLPGLVAAGDCYEDAATVNEFIEVLQLAEENARNGNVVEYDTYTNDRGERVCYYSMDLEYDKAGNPIKILNLYNYFNPDTKEINLIGIDILHPEGDKWVIDDVFVTYIDGGYLYVELQDAQGNMVECTYKSWTENKGLAKFLKAPYCGK